MMESNVDRLIEIWTANAAKEAINMFAAGETYGARVLRSDSFSSSHKRRADGVDLVAESLSHARRMQKTLVQRFNATIVIKPDLDSGYVLSVQDRAELGSDFRYDFPWTDNETAHALTLFHLLLPLDEICQYLQRTNIGVLSRIAKFIRVPMLLSTSDDRLDSYIDKLLGDLLNYAGGDESINYSQVEHLLPLLEVIENHEVGENTGEFITDFVNALQGIGCKKPNRVLEMIITLFEAELNRRRVTFYESSGIEMRNSDEEFENLFPLYVMARKFSDAVDPGYYPAYADADGFEVSKQILNKVIEEIAIGEVAGDYAAVSILTSSQYEKMHLTDLVSKVKRNDPLLQTAYAVAERDLEALSDLSMNGNWYAALIGAKLTDSKSRSPNGLDEGDCGISKYDFLRYCQDYGERSLDGPISDLRACKNQSIVAKRILRGLIERPGSNVVGTRIETDDSNESLFDRFNSET